jgi:cytoskeletal protein RodZ
MKNRTKVKLILLIFFILLFGFLFWFLYQPSNSNQKTETIKDDNSVFNWLFGDEKLAPEKENDKDNKKNTNKIKYD